MPDTPPTARLTLLLNDSGRDAAARRSAAFAHVYVELRRIAHGYLRHERAGHTLQATALVNETWLRLFGNAQTFASGAAFFAAAANTMRRVLIDHARAHGRERRGGGRVAVPLDALELATYDDADWLLAVDDAVSALERQDERLAEQAKLRLFAGLDEADIAAALGVSNRTARRDWLLARAFLQRQMRDEA